MIVIHNKDCKFHIEDNNNDVCKNDNHFCAINQKNDRCPFVDAVVRLRNGTDIDEIVYFNTESEVHK